jgi:hypothetical protein
MTLETALKSQYQAGLAMLQAAMTACPADLWVSDRYANPIWRVAYHTLYYTDLYLQPSEAAFVPWQHHRPGLHRLEASPDPVIPYTADELTAYCRRCHDMIDTAVDRLDLTAPESGFWWYAMPKLEHQLVNLRHLQHHTGQLADRLRQAAGRGIPWTSGTPAP